MCKEKINNAPINVPASEIKPGSNSAHDKIRNYLNPYECFDESMYDEIYYDSKCMSCFHSDGHTCGADKGICIYDT